MARMEEAELHRIGTVTAGKKYEELIKKGNLIDTNDITNAYISGFYMGARFVETPRHPYDWIPDWCPFWKKSRPMDWEEQADRKLAAVDHYLEAHFARVVPKNIAQIQQAVAEGFCDGGDFMWPLVRQ